MGAIDDLEPRCKQKQHGWLTTRHFTTEKSASDTNPVATEEAKTLAAGHVLRFTEVVRLIKKEEQCQSTKRMHYGLKASISRSWT
ncbi:hypothetical protein LOK49_LG08G02889 [Camellia lanceoleosa]|uniref:Uncharacterized protein n=1 Tax=Camellia lanceoleosa TaxID=1840588 RepID=A0ACC0GRH5_9ERIC|nr:hypothetical protein LOK49_LG08G02889 [Camellia lanceoleosa]